MHKVRTNVMSVSGRIFAVICSFHMAPRGILVKTFFSSLLFWVQYKKKILLQNSQIYLLWENLCSAIKSLKATFELGIKMPERVELVPVKQVFGSYKLWNIFELFCAMNLQGCEPSGTAPHLAINLQFSPSTTSKAETSATQSQMNFWWFCPLKALLKVQVTIIFTQSILFICRSKNWTSLIFNTAISLQFLGSSSRICQRAKAWE